jgi:hypothetical protein
VTRGSLLARRNDLNLNELRVATELTCSLQAIDVDFGDVAVRQK